MKLLMLIVCGILLAGCITVTVDNQAGPAVDENNTFVSKIPKVRVTVDQSIKFQEMFEFSQSEEYTNSEMLGEKGRWTSKTYLFTHPDKFVFIVIKRLPKKGDYWIKFDPKKFNRLIKHGKNGEYDEIVNFNTIPLTTNHVKLIFSKTEGFESKGSNFVSFRYRLAVGRSIQLIIGYAEKASVSFLPWKDVNFMSKEQLEEILKFEENAKNAVKLF